MRLDNSCENKKLHEQAESKDLKMNIYFEYTAWDTLQQNYLEEIGFSVLANKGIAMMYRANVPTLMRYQIFLKVFETATLMDRLVVAYIDGKKQSRYKHFFVREPQCVKYFWTWVEAGTVKIKK